MLKGVKIPEEVHTQAKAKADKLGMKLGAFIAMAIKSFDARIEIASRPPRGAHSKAG